MAAVVVDSPDQVASPGSAIRRSTHTAHRAKFPEKYESEILKLPVADSELVGGGGGKVHKVITLVIPPSKKKLHYFLLLAITPP